MASKVFPMHAQAQPKVSFPKKLTLILSGVLSSLIILEIGLRLTGFVIVSIQEHRNLKAIKQKGTYRILCLGESTTQGCWPPFLEQILNQRNIGIQFSVIDEGLTGTTTSVIVAQLEFNLNTYHPDMVITMMGMNDQYVKYYEGISYTKTTLFKNWRTFRLALMVWKHIKSKTKEVRLYKLRKNSQSNPGLQPILTKIAKENYNNHPAENASKDSTEQGLHSDKAYIELGMLYHDHGNFSQAEESFKKAIELNLRSDKAHLELGRLYHDQGKFLQAEDAFKKAVEFNPNSEEAYTQLGWLYRDQHKLSQAEETFKKIIDFNPHNDVAYLGLSRIYRDYGRFSQAEKSFKKVIELNPQEESVYLELGNLYQEQSKLSQTEEILRKALEIKPSNERLLRALLVLYEEMGKPELAREYERKIKGLRVGQYSSVTINNYFKLKEILDKRGVRLICAQYPMRSPEPLKKIFEGNETGIIFVDNERIFKDALKRESYKEYFYDMFAGDFGHCTDKGNRLLAENIAETILKEVFRK